MKRKILGKVMTIIKNNYPNYSDEKLEKINYGIEGLYLTITKLIIIFIVSFMIGIFKEMILLLLFYNVLRFTGFGIHASKSSFCLISSLSVFVGIPIVIKCLTFGIKTKVVLSIISIILFYIYAPADTEKRPLINKKKRLIYKYITVITSIIYSYFMIILKNNLYTNTILFAMLIELFLILPISYKLFNLKFNNYKSYIKNY